MFEIISQPGDDPAFLKIVCQFAKYAAKQHSLALVLAIRIDHWFGENWLGFQGKILGAAGVHNRLLSDDLVVPPFHPNRVKAITRLDRTESGAFTSMQVPVEAIHAKRTCESNTRNYIRDSGIYCWYSGDTDKTSSASLMVYVVSQKGIMDGT